MPIDESTIPPRDRIPRVTSANWKYESGAVGSLSHMLVLQGYRYSCELEICKLCISLFGRDFLPDPDRVEYPHVRNLDADGYQLKLINPYGNPELRVRTPESDEEHVYTVRSRFLSLAAVSNLR